MEALRDIMTDNIIDGSSHFGSKPTRNAVPRSILDIMEEDTSTRIRPEDRVTLASNMGGLAAELDPQDPSRGAKRWFDKWDGDRWQKRKKFICFPGEANRDPAAAGQLAASRGDWRALINAAVHDRFPQAGPAAERDRENLRRTLLRGTKYVPEVERFSAGDADAQRLMISLTHMICDRMADVHELDRLWEVLQTTPFSLDTAGFADFDNNGYDDNAIEMASREASSIRDLVPGFGRGYVADPLVRFCKVSPETADAEIAWAFPQLRLGLLGFQVDTRIFVVPPNVIAQLRAAGVYDICEVDDDLQSWIPTWLSWKGLIHDDGEDRGAWTLPEVEYTHGAGYGWTQFKCEIVREAWLSCRPKADGKPGLWLSVDSSDDLFERFYPVIQIDCLATEAAAPSDLLRNLPFYAPEVGRGYSASGYGVLSWPNRDPVFTIEQAPEFASLPGLLDPLDDLEGEWGVANDLPSVGGWLEDTSNERLQNILFRLPPGARFVSSIPTDPKAPPICRTGTIAETLFANLACLPEERVFLQLAHAGERLAEAGLRFHKALMEHYSRLIDRLPDDA
jgi:hypothetical protein